MTLDQILTVGMPLLGAIISVGSSFAVMKWRLDAYEVGQATESQERKDGIQHFVEEADRERDRMWTEIGKVRTAQAEHEKEALRYERDHEKRFGEFATMQATMVAQLANIGKTLEEVKAEIQRQFRVTREK